MAVTHKLYGPSMKNIVNGSIANMAATGTDIKLALMTSAHSFTQSHEFWSSVSANEVSTALGSTSGHYSSKSLTAKTVANTSTRVTTFDSSNVSFGSTVSMYAYHAVLYYNSASTNKPLISSINFGQKEESVDGNYAVNWNASGIFTITVST
jgi:hypothetical protein